MLKPPWTKAKSSSPRSTRSSISSEPSVSDRLRVKAAAGHLAVKRHPLEDGKPLGIPAEIVTDDGLARNPPPDDERHRHEEGPGRQHGEEPAAARGAKTCR